MKAIGLVGVTVMGALGIGSGDGWAHLTDPLGCTQQVIPFFEALKGQAPREEGLFHDRSSWVLIWPWKQGTVAFHFPLLPESQWAAPDKPAYLAFVSSMWFDEDGDGRAEDVWLVVAPQIECAGLVHLRWIDGQYVVVQGGKDHV